MALKKGMIDKMSEEEKRLNKRVRFLEKSFTRIAKEKLNLIKYENAWEELKTCKSDISMRTLKKMQNLEKKYNIEGRE